MAGNNAAAYPAPITWRPRDQAFIAAGARAYLEDLPDAEFHLIDAGNLAVNEKPSGVAPYILKFISKRQFQ
jgi:hypothetical protein